jgi:hypothetical protein
VSVQLSGAQLCHFLMQDRCRRSERYAYLPLMQQSACSRIAELALNITVKGMKPGRRAERRKPAAAAACLHTLPKAPPPPFTVLM